MNKLVSINPAIDGNAGGLVYFVYEDTKEYLKIGYSEKITERLRTIQNSNPRPLIVLGLVGGGFHFEQSLHQHFSEHRVRGEWFRCHSDIMEAFSNPLNLPVQDAIIELQYLDMGYPKNYNCPCVEVHTCGRKQ